MPAIALHQTNSMKIGTCPHGLPQGACPICSGGGSMKKADFSAKPGEMSWNECAAIGAMLKAQKNAQIQKQQDAQNFAMKAAAFQKNMMNAAQKLVDIGGFFTRNTMPLISKPVNFVLNTIIGSALKFIGNVPIIISKAVNFIFNKFADISDKLTAIMGELKNSIEKKISDVFSNLKKKVKSLFSIFKPLNNDNDEKQIEESKRTFELKTFIHDLYKKIVKDKKENGD